jgi:hypothetical protein
MSRNALLILAGVLGIAGIAAIVFALMAAAVPEGSPTVQTPGPPHYSATAVPVVDPPLHDLNGTWTGDMENGTTMIGTVNGDAIQIVMKKDDASMIYWNGSFRPAATIGDVILSTRVEIPKVVVSPAADKRFVVGDDTMSFEITAMGVTKTVELTRAT